LFEAMREASKHAKVSLLRLMINMVRTIRNL